MPITPASALMYGSAASFGGGLLTAGLQMREAKKNRNFQERMSSTAYQRSMADMRKAGLNPLLAYSKGGASTPGGAQASLPDLGKAATGGISAAMGLAQTKGVQLDNKLKTIQVAKDTITKMPYTVGAHVLDQVLTWFEGHGFNLRDVTGDQIEKKIQEMNLGGPAKPGPTRPPAAGPRRRLPTAKTQSKRRDYGHDRAFRRR